MPAVDLRNRFTPREALAALIRAAVTLAIVDGLFASALSTFAYGSTAARMFQGVASVLLGPDALTGGTRTVALGMLMHCTVATTWSAVFVFGLMRLPLIRRVLGSPFGALKIALFFGPAIWLVMSYVVIPALVHRPPTIAFRWWVQLAAHVPFVGLPIAAATRWKRAA